MAIIKTYKIGICVTGSHFNEVMEFLHKSGKLEFTGTPGGIPEKLISNIEAEKKRASDALDIIRKYVPQKNHILKKRKRAAHTDYAMDKKQTSLACSRVSEILRLEEKIKNNGKKLEMKEARGKSLEDFKSLDVPLSDKMSEYTECVAGVCNISLGKLQEEIEKRKIPIYITVVKHTKAKSVIWCVYLKKDKEAVQKFFDEIEFAKTDLYTGLRTPREEITALLKEKEEILKKSDAFRTELKEAAKARRMIELYYDRLMLKSQKYNAATLAQNTEKTFVISGYIREDEAKRLISALENRFRVAVWSEEAEEDEILPVAFQNNAFTQPVEEITASYSMPSKDDIDPNPVMAVFYYWFFGMMFSDAGYGLLMMLVCGILGFSGMLERERRRMLKMFFWCGVSTTLWGIAYGSFFGDLIGTVSKTFGSGKIQFLPVLIDPVNQALELLIISVAFGMVHILTALIIKLYKRIRQGDLKGAVYDVGLWIGVLLGISVLAAGAGLGIDAIKNTGIVLALLSGIGIVLTGGREKKSLIMRFFSGVLSLYDITGFVGDVLSYSRLMALGLATGVIASVVNVLGSLGGNSPLGLVMFILISVFGHSLNFAINMLGAYVHTNRLQYVEFYQKFYEGGGKRFKPLKMDTKYFDFLE